MFTKLSELILYISEKCKEDQSLGATKLNKILFVADFFHYGITGKSISGDSYVHRKNGPTPTNILQARDSLISSGRASIIETPYFSYSQKRIIAQDRPNKSFFSANELSFVDQVIKYFEYWSAIRLSEWTHELNPWMVTEDGEEIPFFTVFVLKKLPVPRTGIIWAQSELSRLRGELQDAAQKTHYSQRKNSQEVN
jgi:uncharacterized phage-associated protein